MSRTVFIPESIDEKLALKILTTELLGVDKVFVGTYAPYQINAFAVRAIVEKYTEAEVNLLDGRVYGNSSDGWKDDK